MAAYKRTDVQVLFNLLLEKVGTDDSPAGLRKLHKAVENDDRKFRTEIADTYYPRIKKDIQTAIEKDEQTISLSSGYVKELLSFLRFRTPDEFTGSTEEIRSFFNKNKEKHLTEITLMGNYKADDKKVFTKWLDKREVAYSFGDSKEVNLDEVAECLTSNRVVIVFLPTKQKELLFDERWENWVAESRVLPIYSEALITREETTLTKWLRLDNWKKALYLAFLGQFPEGKEQSSSEDNIRGEIKVDGEGNVVVNNSAINAKQFASRDMVVNNNY